MARVLRIVGWALFVVSLLAGIYGVLGGLNADQYPWLSVCIIGWILSQIVLAFARRRARAELRDSEAHDSDLYS